jgi:hypothetical protein
MNKILFSAFVFNPLTTCEEGSYHYPILQMRKLRVKEVSQWSQDSKASSPLTGPVLLKHYFMQPPLGSQWQSDNIRKST